MRILVVEDMKEIQRYYSLGLKRQAVDFDIVESRTEAIECLKRRSYEGAIVDLQLTDDESYSQGIEVLKYLGAVNEGTRALVVSGTPHPQDIIDSYEGGAVKVIAKADKGFAEIAEEFAEQCRGVTLRKYGAFPSLNAYLASPDTIPIWEDSIHRILQTGYPKMQKALRLALEQYAPVLRVRDSVHSMLTDASTKTVYGTFWSKASGFPILVAISSAEGTASFDPPEGAVELREHSRLQPLSIRSWKLPYESRDNFPEFLSELPWLK